MVCLRKIRVREDLNSRRSANTLFRCGQCCRSYTLEGNARKRTVAWDTEVGSVQGFVNFPGTTVMTCNNIPNCAAGKGGIEMLKVCQGEAKVKYENDDHRSPVYCLSHVQR